MSFTVFTIKFVSRFVCPFYYVIAQSTYFWLLLYWRNLVLLHVPAVPAYTGVFNTSLHLQVNNTSRRATQNWDNFRTERPWS